MQNLCALQIDTQEGVQKRAELDAFERHNVALASGRTTDAIARQGEADVAQEGKRAQQEASGHAIQMNADRAKGVQVCHCSTLRAPTSVERQRGASHVSLGTVPLKQAQASDGSPHVHTTAVTSMRHRESWRSSGVAASASHATELRPCMQSFWQPQDTPDSDIRPDKPSMDVMCPISGEKLRLKDLTPVKFAVVPDGDGDEYMDPVSKDAFTNTSQIVVLKPTGDAMLAKTYKSCVQPDGHYNGAHAVTLQLRYWAHEVQLLRRSTCHILHSSVIMLCWMHVAIVA